MTKCDHETAFEGEGREGGHLRLARNLRTNMTDAERRLWSRLRCRQICGARFRRQHPIGPYVVDFVCLEQKLIVEVDGGQHAERVQEDETRTRWLESRGYRVVRFWNNDVSHEIEGVLEVIASHLRSAEAPPTLPSPSRGEGF